MSRSWQLMALAALLAVPADSPSADSLTKTAVAKASDWTQWRGPDRAGISPDVGLLKDWRQRQPTLLWKTQGMGGGYASVSLEGGRIYTTGNQRNGQTVVCVNGEDGKVLWTSRLTDTVPDHSYEGSRCTPTLDGEFLYAIASSGKIACLKTADGSLVWSRDFAEWDGKMMSVWGFSESPLVDGDSVLCTPGGSGAMIVALNKQTGKDIWKTSVPSLGRGGSDGAGYSSIVISNAGRIKQYVQLVGKGVIGVRATDGKFLWGYNRVANGTANIPTPLVFGDYIFCSTGYGTGAALLKLTRSGANIRCDEQYFLPGDKIQNHHGQMVLKDGFVYLGSGHRNGMPACVELATGKIAWGGKERGVGSGSAAITLADGNLVFRYESGEVALIEATPTAYKLKGSFRPEIVGRNPCWSHPVVIGGRMYLRDQDNLMCYDVRE
jgi:outer membrane protein assembly factor BamB